MLMGPLRFGKPAELAESGISLPDVPSIGRNDPWVASLLEISVEPIGEPFCRIGHLRIVRQISQTTWIKRDVIQLDLRPLVDSQMEPGCGFRIIRMIHERVKCRAGIDVMVTGVLRSDLFR